MAGRRKKANLEVVHPRCAGIDIGKKAHYAAVDPERLDEPVRNFGTFTRDLEAMAAWLRSCGVDVVAMESTGVYWIPVFEVLERTGFEVHHVQKALAQMNVQLDNVLSDVMGLTGQLIIRAIVAGERDGAVLASYRDGRCKADEATIAASLEGNWRAEHLFALAQALERYDAGRRSRRARRTSTRNSTTWPGTTRTTRRKTSARARAASGICGGG